MPFRPLLLGSLLTTAVLTITSCHTGCQISGTCSGGSLEGQTIYLKVVKGYDFVTIDSCTVTKGKFTFSQCSDSTQIAVISDGQMGLMPLVTENSDLQVTLGENQDVTGGVLNERLYEFLQKRHKLESRLIELSHKESQMIMEGEDPDIIQIKLSEEGRSIVDEMDFLETDFIVENSDNALGPGMFMIMTADFPEPIMTPKIESILSKVNPVFKENEYVKNYIDKVTEN